MGEIQKIDDEYYVEFMARGLKYQQKAGKDLQKAQELLRQIEDKIAKGELQTISREIALEVFFTEFFKYARTQYHPRTVQRLLATAAHFEKFLRPNFSDVKKLSQVTPRVIEEYKAAHSRQEGGHRLNAKKINLTLILLREILEYGIKSAYINDNPTLHIRLLDIPPGRSLTISRDIFLRILEQVPEHLRVVYIFLRQTGVRISELERLSWQNVDFNRHVIFMKSREIPLNVTALSVLKGVYQNVIDFKAPVFIHAEEVIASQELEVRFHKAIGKSGCSVPAGIAALRHSFAGDLLQMRLSLLLVGKILGVHDVAKLMIYASLIPVSREDIAKGVYGA
jgi:site-specific recombinase XerD